jgi:hypothetical protein
MIGPRDLSVIRPPHRIYLIQEINTLTFAAISASFPSSVFAFFHIRF